MDPDSIHGSRCRSRTTNEGFLQLRAHVLQPSPRAVRALAFQSLTEASLTALAFPKPEPKLKLGLNTAGGGPSLQILMKSRPSEFSLFKVNLLVWQFSSCFRERQIQLINFT